MKNNYEVFVILYSVKIMFNETGTTALLKPVRECKVFHIIYLTQLLFFVLLPAANEVDRFVEN